MGINLILNLFSLKIFSLSFIVDLCYLLVEFMMVLLKPFTRLRLPKTTSRIKPDLLRQETTIEANKYVSVTLEVTLFVVYCGHIYYTNIVILTVFTHTYTIYKI